MALINASDFEDFIDAPTWINQRISADSVSIDKIDSFLNNLHLQLNILTQEISEGNDILSADYLKQIPSLQLEINRMGNESHDAITRLFDLTKSHEILNDIKDPSLTLTAVTDAKDKIHLAKKALTRGRRSLR